MLIVGGVAEMKQSHPERIRLVLKNRKGFIKVALQTGAQLVPVFSFGENEIYDEKIYAIAQHHDLWFKLDRVTFKEIKTRNFWIEFIKGFVTLLVYAMYMFTTLPKRRQLTTIGNKNIK